MNRELDAKGDLSIPRVSEDEHRLVAAIAQGDAEAEREFAVRYMPRVQAMLRSRSGNPDVAADLRQEVMIEAICALRRGQLRDADRLTPFVLGIARNLLNSHFRSATRQPEALEFPDDLPDLRETFDFNEESRRETLVAAALETLEPVDRRILRMTLIDGLKPGAIASQLRLGPDVVRQRKLRATRRVVEFVTRQSQKGLPDHLQARQEI